MKSSFAARGILSGVALLAAALMFLVIFGAARSDAASPKVSYSGSATFTVGAGKTGKALRGKVVAISPAKAKRQGKKIHVSAPVKNFTGDVALKGGIRFKSGKRKTALTGLIAKIGETSTTIKGKLGGKTITVFSVAGKSVTSGDTANGSVRITPSKLTLSAAAAKAIKKALKLKRLPAGQVGSFSLFADVKTTTTPPECLPADEGCNPPVDPCLADPTGPGCPPAPVVDPYLAQCGVDATSEVAGTLPAAAPLPTLAGAEDTVGPANQFWGFKSSFRGYVAGSGGSLKVADGAELVGTAPVFTGFNFPFASGKYTDNGTDSRTDDQAIVNSSGTALFCATTHKFRVAIKNPTVVIDGANSRIVADIDTNLTGVWTPSQRIDLATLDLTGITPEAAAANQGTTWADVPAALTQAGADAICGTGEQAACTYTEGTAIDPITVSAEVAIPDDPYLAQCGVEATSLVNPSRADASALPDMTGSKALTGPASFDWGFKSSFRGYIYGTNAATAPNSVFTALNGATRAAGGSPSRGFTFQAGDGQYLAGDPVDMTDDKAVINGTGTTVYCNRAHGFWMEISDPTIVIDGANSKIQADVATNDSGAWTSVQRIDLANLNLAGITPFYNRNGSEVSWGSVPATLTAAAAPLVTYSAGEALDAIDVTVNTAYDTSDLNALATYVSTELPFPLPDNTLGGCTLPSTAGGSASAARTIDEHLFYNGTTTAWNANGSRPAAEPVLTGGNAVTGGSFQWGVRRALRSSVNSTGLFNLYGTTASHTPYFGNGPGSTPRLSPGPGNMGGAYPETPQRYFQWPAATSGSTFQENGAGTADDKLVLKSTGRVGICQTGTGQGYGTVLSDPTVVIDGANSRITVDVATRYRLSWVRGRVDLATIDMTDPAITANVSSAGGTTTAAWTFPRVDESVSPNLGPIKLTESGRSVFNMISTSGYIAGTPLDAAIITATFPDPT